MINQVSQKVTDGVAFGAATSPFWLDKMVVISELAEQLLPFFGIAWLSIQMVTHWRNTRRIENYVRREAHEAGRVALAKEIKETVDKVEIPVDFDELLPPDVKKEIE